MGIGQPIRCSVNGTSFKGFILDFGWDPDNGRDTAIVQVDGVEGLEAFPIEKLTALPLWEPKERRTLDEIVNEDGM